MSFFPLTQKVNDQTFRRFRQALVFLCVLCALCAFAVNNRGFQDKKARQKAGLRVLCCYQLPDAESLPLYCKQDIFIFYIQWLIFLLIGNTMKNTMLRKGLTIF